MGLDKRQARLLKQLTSQGLLGPTPNIKMLKRLPAATFPMPKAPDVVQKPDYAEYLVTKALKNDKGVSTAIGKSIASNKDAQEESKSMISRLFDTLMIPNYFMANVGDSVAQGMQDDNKGGPDSFLDNLGQELKGVAKATYGTAARVADATFANPAEMLPFGIGDKVTEGLKNAEKNSPARTFEDVLHNRFGVDNKFARYGGGLALDVITDPLTYVGPGLFTKGKSAKDLLDAKAAVPEGGLVDSFRSAKANQAFVKPPAAPQFKLPEAPPVAELALRGNAIPNNAFGQLPKLPRVQVGTPLEDIAREATQFAPRTRGLTRKIGPDGLTDAQRIAARSQEILNPARSIEQKMLRKQADFERAMTKSGMVANKTSQINMRSVNEVVHRIQEGRVPATLPKLPTATGEQAVKARDLADDFIDAAMNQKFNKKSLRWHDATGKMITRRLPPEITASQQIAMYNRILAKAGPKTFEESKALLRAAEDHLITLGVQPVRQEGIRVRLSDVMNLVPKMSPKDILNNFARKDFSKMDPEFRDALQTVIAYRTSAMSDILDNLTTYAAKAKQSAQEFVGRPKAVAESNIINKAFDQGLAAGMSNKELSAIMDPIKDIVNINKLPAETYIETAAKDLQAAVHAGKADPKLLMQFNEKVAETVGITGKNLQDKITGSKPIDMIMNAVTTWHGKEHLLNPARATFDWGMLNAQARARTMRSIAKNYTPDEIKASWKVLVGVDKSVQIDGRVAELANFMRNYMDHMLKVPSYGIKLDTPGVKNLSTADKSMMLMHDVNRHLKDMNGPKAFQFSAKQFDRDAWEISRDFSTKGEGWQASWARWSPDDPVKFLFDVDMAMERATKEYAFLDNFVYNWGKLTPDADHTFKLPIERIGDFYVPEPIGREMMRTMDMIHKGGWKPSSDFGRYYQKALRIWKTSVTIYLPSHHIRNAIGDVNLMWLAGHNDPRAFIWSKRIMHSQRTKYKEATKAGDFATQAQLTDPSAAKWAATRGGDVIITERGVPVTADQLYVGAHQRGLLKDANQIEDIFGESRIGIRPLGGHANRVATTAAEYREHYIRLAHFTSAVKKNLKKNKDIQKAMDVAADEVRKWHPDGTDLTRFEQKYMRSLMPFYSWLRKSTPLLFESLVQRPAKALAYPRGMTTLQQLLGQEGVSVADPFPDDQLFPQWIRDYGIGPIGNPVSDNPFSKFWGLLGKNMVDERGDHKGYTVVNPSLPMIDFFQQYGGSSGWDTGRGIVDTLSPFIKVPYEVATDQQFTGQPISREGGGPGLLTYLRKQVPQIAPAQRVADWGEKKRPDKEQGLDKEAIVNMLTALGIHGTGPYIKSAEYELKDKLRAKKPY